MIDFYIFQTYFRTKSHVVDVPIEAPPATRIEGKKRIFFFRQKHKRIVLSSLKRRGFLTYLITLFYYALYFYT